MATTLTPDSAELTYFSFPIEKHEDTDTINPVDGTPDIVVYGKATDGSVDSDLQIVDPDWSGKALQEWFNTGGNVRVQHQAKRDPAGTGLGVDLLSDGHYVRSLVSEPTAKHLVRTGALRDYSIGVSYPDIRPDPTGKAMNGVITGRQDGKTRIAELSLVDRGSNFNSRFQLVKSAADGTAEFVGKMLTDMHVEAEGNVVTDADLATTVQAGVERLTVTKGVSYEGSATGVNVTLPNDVSVSFKPSDLAKLLAHRATAEKRNMDPNVGGGVDRDKVPAADFAGPDRSFPIVTPGDVSDAASSLGRTKHDPAEVKRRIISIAHRKGPSFVAQLPDSWTTGDSDKKVTVDVEKGAKDCPKCGKTYHADSKVRTCESCGADLPNADGSDKADALQDALTPTTAATEGDVTVLPPAVIKKDKVLCPGCGANHDAGHSFCPECGRKVASSDLALGKNHDYTCLGCGKSLDDGEKYCPGCGKQNPGFNEADKAAVRAALKAALEGGDVITADEPDEDATKAATAPTDQDETAEGSDDAPSPASTVDGGGSDGDADDQPPAKKAKGGKKVKAKASKETKAATPTDGVTETTPAKPAPAHREPDGPAIEALERDAGMPTTPDATAKTRGVLGPHAELEALMRLKGLDVPVDLGKLHDLTCPCYHPDDVAKCYPNDSLATLDPAIWQQKAFDLVSTAPLEKAQEATLLWQRVVTLKNTDPGVLEELRSAAYKAFNDANPGPGTAPTPTQLSPGRFKRPYLDAGHAAPSPGHDGPNTATVPSSSISAAGYQRSFLSSGHAADSPANGTRPEPIQPPATTGVPSRTFYTNAQRDNARQAMSAMHDHIAQTFPDLCPMFTGGPYGGEALPQAKPVPVGVGSPAPHGAPAAKATGPGKALKRRRKELEKAVLAGTVTLEAARAELGALAASLAPAPVEKTTVVTTETVAPTVERAATVDVATVEKMISAAVAARDEELAELRKTIKKQARQIDRLAEEPAPGGPFRGAAMTLPAAVTKAAPEALPSLGHAERTQQLLFDVMREQWRTNPDPTQRELAWAELTKMTGIGHNTVNK